jgi:hypothetical protein
LYLLILSILILYLKTASTCLCLRLSLSGFNDQPCGDAVRPHLCIPCHYWTCKWGWIGKESDQWSVLVIRFSIQCSVVSILTRPWRELECMIYSSLHYITEIRSLKKEALKYLTFFRMTWAQKH